MDCAYLRTHEIKNQRFLSVIFEWNSFRRLSGAEINFLRYKLMRFLPQKSQKTLMMFRS